MIKVTIKSICKKVAEINVNSVSMLLLFGVLFSACNNQGTLVESEQAEISTPLELRDAGCFTVVRDFCAPGECCTYTACSDYSYEGVGQPFTLVSNSINTTIIPHQLVVGQPMCWTINTCESVALTMMAGSTVACTEYVKCGSCPVIYTFNQESTNNLRNDKPEYADCCIFNFTISPYNIPPGCEILVQTGPRGGVKQNDLQGTIRVCQDEPIEVVLSCEEDKSCSICSLDAVCP